MVVVMDRLQDIEFSNSSSKFATGGHNQSKRMLQTLSACSQKHSRRTLNGYCSH